MAKQGAWGPLSDPIGGYEAQNEGIKGVPEYTEKTYARNQRGSHGDHPGRGDLNEARSSTAPRPSAARRK